MILVLRNRLIIFLSAAIGIEACVVMIGWIFSIERLTRFVSAGSNMRFITAFLFLLSALGLYAMSRAVQYDDALARLLLPGLALSIFLVTATVVASRIFDTSTGIENLYLTSFDPYLGVQTAGLPSFLTLFNFSLFGMVCIASLFLGSLRDRFAIYAGYFISFVGCVAILGYVLNLPSLYNIGSVNGVSTAFNTALCFVFLGIGLTQIFSERKIP